MLVRNQFLLSHSAYCQHWLEIVHLSFYALQIVSADTSSSVTLHIISADYNQFPNKETKRERERGREVERERWTETDRKRQSDRQTETWRDWDGDILRVVQTGEQRHIKSDCVKAGEIWAKTNEPFWPRCFWFSLLWYLLVRLPVSCTDSHMETVYFLHRLTCSAPRSAPPGVCPVRCCCVETALWGPETSCSVCAHVASEPAAVPLAGCVVPAGLGYPGGACHSPPRLPYSAHTHRDIPHRAVSFASQTGKVFQ